MLCVEFLLCVGTYGTQAQLTTACAAAFPVITLMPKLRYLDCLARVTNAYHEFRLSPQPWYFSQSP